MLPRRSPRWSSLFDALDGADCVIGSRWLPGSIVPERQGIARRFESRGFNLLIRLLFGLSLTDTQCGAKVFKKSAVDAVIGDMLSSGFEFDVELLWRLSQKGYRDKGSAHHLAEPGGITGEGHGRVPHAPESCLSPVFWRSS